MPELPEVETTLRAIDKFTNQRIKSIKIHNRNLRWRVDKNLEIISRNQLVKALKRRAKYIIFELDTSSLILHLGMSGSLRISNVSDNYFIKHDHIEFIFDNEKIIYNDPRRFGSLHITSNIDTHNLIRNLGAEPLSNDFNGIYLFDLCSKSKTNIKTLLMNQKNVVGIGNIYASETLHLSKINPRRLACNISLQECKKIVSSSKKILKAAIKVGGTTLKDFYSADGSPGYFNFALKVYGREGLKCMFCDGKIKKINLNMRATYYCSNCQI